MFIGLTAYVKVLHDNEDQDVSLGWSYSVGWLALVLALVCSLYFTGVAWYRWKHPSSGRPRPHQIYAPLTQMNESSSDSDSDYGL